VLLKILDNEDNWNVKCLKIVRSVSANRTNCQKRVGMCGIKCEWIGVGLR
jgi:hypothetical protein